MSKLIRLLLACTIFVGAYHSRAIADWAATAGSGLTFFAFTCFTSKICPAHVNIDNAGTEIFTAAAPGYARIASGGVASGAVASGAIASGAVASGAMVDLGAQADAVCGSATGTCSLIALVKYLNAALNTATPAGTNAIGSVSLGAVATGGCTPHPVVASAASTNAASVKASAGTLCDFMATNSHTSIQYVHFFNTAGSPTCNASIIQTIAIPPASSAGLLGGVNRALTYGHAYGTGIGICITANADGTGNATAGAVLLNIGYK